MKSIVYAMCIAMMASSTPLYADLGPEAAHAYFQDLADRGVRVVDDVRRLLNAGADKVSMNTAAVQNPQLVADASGKVGRNDPCPCGSGKKYKQCHGRLA